MGLNDANGFLGRMGPMGLPLYNIQLLSASERATNSGAIPPKKRG